MGFKLKSFIVAALFVFFFGQAARAQQSVGYWVIVASEPVNNWDNVYRIREKALACNLRLFNDFSGKFLNFREGYEVYVIDHPFQYQKQANQARQQALPCFPSAYVKYGEYLGE